VEGLDTVRQFRASMDCLVAFLAPPTAAAHGARLRSWLGETQRAVSRYAVDARQQTRDVLRAGIYDVLLQNRKVNEAVEEALGIARDLLPDLFKDVSTGALRA
jgi:guanylate kinase